MKQKGKSSFQRLMGYAGKRKYLTYLSLALAAVSAVIALIPFYEIWRIIKEVLEVRPDFSQAVHIKTYGWYAVGGALLSMLFLHCGADVFPSGGVPGAGKYADRHDGTHYEAAAGIRGKRGNG